jgi:hypothetical protein
MGVVTAAVVTGAAAAYSANKQSKAAKSAGRAQENAAREGIEEQRRQFDTFQGNIQPYLGIGQQATGTLSGLMSGDMTAFHESPDYQWRFNEGMRGLDRNAASRGSLFSGGTDLDRMNYGQGLASTEYGNFWNRTMDAARLGQNSAVGAGHMGMGMANNISGLLGNIGQAQGNSAINQANAWGNAANGIAGAVGTYLGGRQTSYQQPYGGSLGPSNGFNWNFGGGG